MTKGIIEQDSARRKDIPIATGVLDYFPAAIAAVAEHSKRGNDKHNPGEPLNWSRGKSTDHADCIARHLIERGGFDEDGYRHSTALAWRALALLQTELEAEELVDVPVTPRPGTQSANGEPDASFATFEKMVEDAWRDASEPCDETSVMYRGFGPDGRSARVRYDSATDWYYVEIYRQGKFYALYRPDDARGSSSEKQHAIKAATAWAWAGKLETFVAKSLLRRGLVNAAETYERSGVTYVGEDAWEESCRKTGVDPVTGL